MNATEAFTAELKIEAATTRKMLERVPQASISWRPHARSRTLGEIATHIAGLPGVFIAPLLQDEFDHDTYVAPAATVGDIVATFDRNVVRAHETLNALSEKQLLEPWRYRFGERVIFELPRFVVIRTSGLNHLIHHRGQLSVYLRMLDVPLPSVYGPTADET